MNNPGKAGCARLVTALIATLLVLAVIWFGYILPRTSRRGNITIGISNCRQIITGLRIYSADHGGKYPDAAFTNPQNSNEVLRVLFKEGIIDNEMLFGCPVSPFKPDGDIGSAPDFGEALEAGENHWAMTAGLGDSDSGDIPLMYENTSNVSWPPTWNSQAKGKKIPGRTCSNGIIVGLNDSSVSIQPIQFKDAPSTGLAKVPEQGNTDLFEASFDPKGNARPKVLDVLRKK